MSSEPKIVEANTDKINQKTVEYLGNAFLGLIRIYYIQDNVPRPEKPLEVLNALAATAAVIIHGCESETDSRAERFFDKALELSLEYWRKREAPDLGLDEE